MVRPAKRALLSALFLLTAASAAQAAYAPKLEVKLSPPAQNSPSGVTTRVTQASDETASKTIKISFPAGFTLIGPKVQLCTADQEQNDQCPPQSQIGSARADTGLATLTGPVYLERGTNAPLRLAVSMTGLGGLVSQKAYGDVDLVGGRVAVVFDNLPNTATTLFQLDLQGGDKALTMTPKTCGPATFDGDFTSQQSEHATAQATVTIGGCPTTPFVSALSVKPRVFKAVHRFADSERPGYATTLHYTLSEATNGTRVKVQKQVGHHWHRAGSFIASGDRGPNKLRFDGRLSGRSLTPGHYRFVVQTTSRAGLRSKPRSIRFGIRR